jgi:predicted enzyme related to lactoylglutathione lyase
MVGNIAYFEVPVDDLERAKQFYSSVLGWQIKTMPMPNMPDYSGIKTGEPFSDKEMSYLNVGGMVKRMMPNQPITTYVEVKSVDETIAKAKEAGGKQMGETLVIPAVGRVAFLFDTENNVIGIWEPIRI